MEVFMINYFDDLNFKLSPSSLSAAPRQSSIDINKFTLKTLKVAVPRRSPLGRRLEVFMKHKIMQTILCIYFLSVQTIAFSKAFFTPGHDLTKIFLERIDAEKKSIYGAMYMFTDKKIAQALIGAKKRGIDVQMVIDQIKACAIFLSVNIYIAP